MANEYKTIKLRLNGKQSVSIPIDLKRNGVLITDSVDVMVRGFLKFESSGEPEETTPTTETTLIEKTVIYPVLFITDRITVADGHCVITLAPRSEDLFEDTDSLQESVTVTVTDDELTSSGEIRTDEVLGAEKQPVTITIESGITRRPYWISIEITVFSDDGSVYAQTVDRGTSPQIDEVSDISSLFNKRRTRTPSNLVVECYNDEEWIPTVTSHLTSNVGTTAQVLAELNNLDHSTPFGLSTMYDAIYLGADILSDNDVDAYRKTIYVFTDNEANSSIHTLDQAIAEINYIDGYKEVPVVVGNFNIVDPATLSVKANSSDTRDINKLAYLTDGQSVTVNTENYADEVVAIFYGEAIGSLGYGTYEFVVDLQEEVLVNNIRAFFDIPDNEATASWQLETSLNGYEYTALNKVYAVDDIVELENLYARYVKFSIILVTGFADDNDPYAPIPESPALTGVQIIYNSAKVAYLYLNPEEVDTRPYQITLAVDANDVNDQQIFTGVAKSDSHNWIDYHLDGQPSVLQNGKVVIPIRFSQDTAEFQQEPLYKVDTFLLETEYGNWDPFATVTLYDKNDNLVSTNKYSIDPRRGHVILNFALPTDYADGDYKIGILNSSSYKIGMKLTNKSTATPLDIYGIGYVYTTGKDLLPPLTKAAPEAREAQIVNEVPNKFSIMTLSYTYYDENFDTEDTTKRRIKWYINGTPVSYLENKMSWNDLNDAQDPLYEFTALSYPTSSDLAGDNIETWAAKQGASILNAGDSVHCEVQVTDGELYGEWTATDPVTVIESTPVLGAITLKSKHVVTGELSSRITSDRYLVLDPPLDQAFYSDSEVNTSEIIWYVNDEIFKKGYYGDPPAADQSVIHEIRPNEVGKEAFIDYALRIGNTIYCTITPRTGTTVGETITVANKTVSNALPEIENLAWLSTSFPEQTTITLAWNFWDYEVFALKDVDETQQSDQSTVEVYRKNPNQDFEKVYTYNDHSITPTVRETVSGGYSGQPFSVSFGADTSSLTIDGSILKVIGQQWYVRVIPHDSIEYGTAVQSTTITITASS